VGIAPDKLEHIFEPFFTYRQNVEGNRGIGLGLALVRWIIEIHNGTIGVSSRLGFGTEFTISLPYNNRTEQTS
jgi:signal transduction histidine kinase